MAQILIMALAVFQLVGLGNWGPSLGLANHVTQPSPTMTLSVYQPLAAPSGSLVMPTITATGALAIDAATGQTLYAKEPDKARPIASITKMFTILVILRDHSLDETVTVPMLPAYEPNAVLLNAPAGAKFKLGDLVKAALIPSDNDAADILAIHDGGSVAAFTAKMNQLMADWQIKNVHFASANGLDDANNYATPSSLALAARLLLTNQAIKTITATQSTTINDLAGRTYPLKTSNQLLQTPGFYGIKTGYTPLSGQCLVALAQIHGHNVITVVLGSSDRFGETKTLADAISKGYQWQ